MSDLRKEQLALLRFEKQIAGLAATLAAGAVVARGVDGKLHASQGTQAYADIQAALVNLAEVTSNAHDVLNAKAVEAGITVMQATGGIPKRKPSEAVLSILGIG
ncbi:hypothetical protein [Hyphococcus sp.]|uniref:hypothetical protein n=1 Tax=Hyphococcus sp. TaxID=2038636 RepID=UPI003CCC186A